MFGSMADVVASMADVVDALRHEETLLALFCTNMFLITIALFMQTIRQPTSLATEEVAAAALSAEPSATIGEADGGALAMTGAADSGARRNQSSDRPTSKHRFTGLEPSEPGAMVALAVCERRGSSDHQGCDAAGRR